MLPKTHDLYLLLDLCRPYYAEIDIIVDKCAILNPYSSQPRYPREIIITKQSMKAAIENAKAIYRFTELLLAPKKPVEDKKPAGEDE